MPLFQLTDELLFPDPNLALDEGLLAVGGDLSEERLLLAYANGIFPWYSEGDPILWWSPDPRMVLFLDEFHLSRRFARTLRGGRWRVTYDTHFEHVIDACAAVPRAGQDGTWITPAMREAYVRLHRAGYAHSVEAWRDGNLAGGMYGVSLGACFFGESMFSLCADGSKVAMARLVQRLAGWNFRFCDCQTPSEHLASLGAREITREAFLEWLDEGLKVPTRVGSWSEQPKHSSAP